MIRRLPLLLILASGCEAPGPQATTPAPPPLPRFGMATREKTYGDCVAGREGCTYIRFDYPVLTEVPAGIAVETISETIQSFLLRPLRPIDPNAPIGEDAGQKTAAQLMESFLDDFRGLKAREPNSAQSWFFERKAFVLNNRPNVLSLSLGENSYLGGAHGSATFHFVNLDPKSGAPIALEDVFREGAASELTALVEARFREVRHMEEGASLESAGFQFATGQFALTSNFAVGSDGLTFYYNPYEIGAYALGPTEIVLGYGEIRELLDPVFLSDLAT